MYQNKLHFKDDILSDNISLVQLNMHNLNSTFLMIHSANINQVSANGTIDTSMVFVAAWVLLHAFVCTVTWLGFANELIRD